MKVQAARMKMIGSLLFAGCLAVSVAQAGTISADTNPADFNDPANWSTVTGTTGSSFQVTSSNGIGVTATTTSGGTLSGLQQGSSWSGLFPGTDSLVYNGCAFTEVCGDITLTFSSPVSGLGMFIQTNSNDDAYTDTITLFDSSDDLLGSEVFDAAAGTAPFIGIVDTTAEIASAVISDNDPNDDFSPDDFAIDTVNLADTGSATPEPATSLFMGAALLGLVALRLTASRTR